MPHDLRRLGRCCSARSSALALSTCSRACSLERLTSAEQGHLNKDLPVTCKLGIIQNLLEIQNTSHALKLLQSGAKE